MSIEETFILIKAQVTLLKTNWILQLGCSIKELIKLLKQILTHTFLCLSFDQTPNGYLIPVSMKMKQIQDIIYGLSLK
jgi:hypothetical protein